MAVYEYEHIGNPCSLGKIFEVTQSMSDRPLTVCPQCAAPVKKLISRTNISTPKSDSELRDFPDLRCFLASRLTWSGLDAAALKTRGSRLKRVWLRFGASGPPCVPR